MKLRKFSVVELKDGNRATILDGQKKGYLAEIVSPYGISLGNKIISKDDINKVLLKKEYLR
ncbi:MAG: hypothetical protein IJE05_06715 [Clostridia bacterium]|nr:hypothetical protein [Clostridia bacterium]